MIKIFFCLLLFSISVLAGLPPTTSKVSGDTGFKTTFNFDLSNFTGTHSGTTVSITGVPASLLSGQVAPANGGTGLSAIIGAGKFLYSNGSVYSGGTLTPGTGITISDSSGNITINATATASPLTTKGDIYTYSLGGDRLPVGGDGQFLSADSQNGTLGIGWKNPTYKNYVKNPTCLVDTSNITVTSGTIARNTSSPLAPTADCAISATGTGGKYAWAINTFDNALTAIPSSCEAKFNYTGTATAFKAYVVIGGVTQLATLKGTLDSSGVYDLDFPCASGAATLNIEATAPTSAINVANVYVGPQTNIGSVSVVTDWTAYTQTTSASVSNPTEGTGVTKSAYWRRVGDSMEVQITYAQTGAGAAGSGKYLWNLPTGYTIDTTKLTVNTSSNIGAGGSVVGHGFVSTTTANTTSSATFTEVLVYDSTHVMMTNLESLANQRNSVDLNNYSYANATLFHTLRFTVPIVGWTSTSSAIRTDQTDIPWTDYTPNAGVNQGLGTVVVNKCQWSRLNADMWIRCNLTTGTVSASEARLALPTGYTSDSSLPIIQGVGRVYRGANANDQTFVAIEASKTYLVFTVQNAGANSMTKQIGSNTLGSAETISFVAGPIPIQGWSSTGRAPTLVGSVTSSSGVAERIERFKYYTTAAGTTCTGTPCGITTSLTGATITRSGTGIYKLNFPAGTWASLPSCTIYPQNTGAVIIPAYQTAAATVTSLDFITTTTAGAGSDSFGDIICMGPRN